MAHLPSFNEKEGCLMWPANALIEHYPYMVRLCPHLPPPLSHPQTGAWGFDDCSQWWCQSSPPPHLSHVSRPVNALSMKGCNLAAHLRRQLPMGQSKSCPPCVGRFSRPSYTLFRKRLSIVVPVTDANANFVMTSTGGQLPLGWSRHIASSGRLRSLGCLIGVT
ncbi:hypothetical protein SK128_003081 [Halocaridina rubra]|uniref:Uncharacterized protein n=1 Tax=Halocaridina rubra TaxID=373956 RepID=A0AAN8ZZN0_HALRR